MDLKQLQECPDCASTNILHNDEREQLICKECGLIYEPLTPVEEQRFESAHNLSPPNVSKKVAAKKPVKRKK